jgi:hypothetical protein
MSKKPLKKPGGKKISHARALEQHTATLLHHSKAIQRQSLALAARTLALSSTSAKVLVYSILSEPLTLPDSTPLSKLGLDAAALAGTAAAIRARGVDVQVGAVQACTTIAQLVEVVAAAD